MKILQITENISHTSKRIHDIEKEKGVKPGTPEWFKLWFSLPYLKESITEAFDNPYEFKVTHNDGNRWQAQALTDNNIIISFLASNVDTGWGIDFKTADADTPNNTTYDLTGKGDGQRTMTTVLAMLKQFIQDHSPEEIYFDAAKDAGNSRTNLYQRIVQRFAGGLGYTVDVQDAGNRDDFTLVKKVQETTVTEALNNPYSYYWDETYNDDSSFLAKAEMDMGELMVMFSVGEPGESWTIDFAVDGSMDKTGDGDQFRIFATVVAVIKDWMANKVDLSKVTQIDFSSDKDGEAEDSRAKLYKRFGQQLASKLGWNLEVTDRGQFASFKIKNPNAPVKEAVNEGYKLQLERDTDMMVLNITDTATGKRTEVRGKPGYETDGYDPTDKLHQLLDKISKTANISDLMNGEPVGINPKHPDGARAKKATTKAFNEAKDGIPVKTLKGMRL